jgi:hypothetical protein
MSGEAARQNVMNTSAATAALASATLGLATLVPGRASAQETIEQWTFAATLYAWLPDIAGNTTFGPGGGTAINIDAETILDHLEMAGQGSFSVQKGRWGAYTDLIYLAVGASKSQTRRLTVAGRPLPAAVTAAAKLDLDTVIWTLGASYRIEASPSATFDVLAGARFADLETTLKWQFTGNFGPIVAPPQSGSSERSADLLDGIVGVKGQLALGAERKWIVPFYFDVGAGDSELTWQALVAVGYAFGWGDLNIGWRYLDYDLESGAPIADLNVSGPALGATFRW